MADWTQPTTLTNYDVFVAEMKARDEDAATMFAGSASNLPINSMRFDRTNKVFQNWHGPTLGWANLPIAVIGGGTGATDAAGARANLGIGTMGVQNSNTVDIRGGAIWGITLLDLNCSIRFFAPTYDIGQNVTRIRNVYIGGALCIPVGADKFATS